MLLQQSTGTLRAARAPGVGAVVHRPPVRVGLLAVQGGAASGRVRAARPVTAGVLAAVLGLARGGIFAHGLNVLLSSWRRNRRNVTKRKRRNETCGDPGPPVRRSWRLS